MVIARYHAMNYKTINSVVMIYILPTPGKDFGDIDLFKWEVTTMFMKRKFLSEKVIPFAICSDICDDK